MKKHKKENANKYCTINEHYKQISYPQCEQKC